MPFVAPSVGQRKYRLALWVLLTQSALASFGIFRGVDMMGLAALVGSIASSVLGFNAWGNRGEWQARGAARQPARHAAK